MSIISKIFGGGAKATGEGIKSAGEGVKTALDSGGGFLKSIRTAITGVDADSKARIEEALTGLESSLATGGQEIEKIITLAAVQHKNPIVAVFLAGWRPFIGWIAGLSLAAYFLPQYIIGSAVWARAAWMAVPYRLADGTLIIPELPAYPVSAEGLLELTLGMLGLVAARSIEKYAGTHNRH
jgi:hypothetical protein